MHFHSSAQRLGGGAVNEKWRRGTFIYPYLMKASAHNQSLVERVPAGRAFSWCKLSIRSEEQKYKEACVKDWIPTRRTREGGARRDLRGIDLPFPLYLQFSASFFPAIPAVAVEFACQFSSFHCFCSLSLHVGWIWEGASLETRCSFSQGCCFSCLSAWLVRFCGLTLLQIWLLKCINSSSLLLLIADLFCLFIWNNIFLWNNKSRFQMDLNCY